MARSALITAIALTAIAASALLYSPAKKYYHAAEGNLSVKEISSFISEGVSRDFSFKDVPVKSSYKTLGYNPRETILCERTLERQIISHRVFDMYGTNGMAEDNFVFEKSYSDSTWHLVYIHPDRNGPNNPIKDLQDAIYSGNDISQRQQGEFLSDFHDNLMPLSSIKRLAQITHIMRDSCNIDVSGFKVDYHMPKDTARCQSDAVQLPIN